MPVGEYYDRAVDQAVDPKRIRKFRRRRKLTPPKGRMVEVARNIYALEPDDHPDPHPVKDTHPARSMKL